MVSLGWACSTAPSILKFFILSGFVWFGTKSSSFIRNFQLSEKLKPTQNPALSIVIIEFEGEKTKRNVADGEKEEGLPM